MTGALGPDAQVSASRPLTWKRTPVMIVATVATVLIAAVGLVMSRPDVLVIALPLGIWVVLVVSPRRDDETLLLRLTAQGRSDAAEVTTALDVQTSADWVQLSITQSELPSGMADVGSGEAVVTARSMLLHSGPAELVAVTSRAVAADGAWISLILDPVRLRWNAVPRTTRLSGLPMAPKLRGLYGAHNGRRPGQGGDFRDIHPFAPGDELRRVDWRSTARLARRRGDLFVRRTNTLSEASVVLAIDTAEDLGEVVASWGTFAPERSGVTSLDFARAAALSLASAAILAGDRVSLHELSPGGRSVPAGTGARQLARIRSAIAATGVSQEITRFRRTPPVPQGAAIFIMSTFFDGAAAQLATMWQASGHRVIAIDVLPTMISTRLTPEQRSAVRLVTAERDGILADLRRVGVVVVPWRDGGADAELLAAMRERR